jgi:hypothetical protein
MVSNDTVAVDTRIAQFSTVVRKIIDTYFCPGMVQAGHAGKHFIVSFA